MDIGRQTARQGQQGSHKDVGKSIRSVMSLSNMTAEICGGLLRPPAQLPSELDLGDLGEVVKGSRASVDGSRRDKYLYCFHQ